MNTCRVPTMCQHCVGRWDTKINNTDFYAANHLVGSMDGQIHNPNIMG